MVRVKMTYVNEVSFGQPVQPISWRFMHQPPTTCECRTSQPRVSEHDKVTESYFNACMGEVGYLQEKKILQL